jgi:hypothetical protein
MCDLNATELAWTKMKNYIRNANTQGNLTLKRLKELTEDTYKTVTKDLMGYCSHVRKLEPQYWQQGGTVSHVIH